MAGHKWAFGVHDSMRRVFIASAASGIGAAAAERFAAAGYAVYVGYARNAAGAATTVQRIAAAGGVAEAIQCDICHAAQVFAAADKILQAGPLHVLIHSASAPIPDTPVLRSDWESFHLHLEVSLKGAFSLAKVFVPAMVGGDACIIHVLSSVVVATPPPGKAAYTAAKYGLWGYSKTLAVELAPKGIRVNTVSPGFTDTPLTAGVEPLLRDAMRKAVPMKKLAEPLEVADVLLFLASDAARYLTGVNIPVCGGSWMP